MNEELQSQTETEVKEDNPTETKETVETTETTSTTAQNTKNPKQRYYIAGAVIVVLLLFVSLLYVMEQNGRINTNLFTGVERLVSQHEVVATVDGKDISAYDLGISTEQITAGALAQGVDVEDPEVQQDIKEQALEVLINTKLLLLEAEGRGIAITDEEVDSRYEQLILDVGGEEALKARMAQFNITDEVLQADIRTELTVQKLLDQVFSNEELAVTEAEILELYNNAGGEAAGLPPLETVREQIEQQVSFTKEQQVVDKFVQELRADANIEIHIEI
jgi:peptidyl-prolyl cis-trans isomerase SurA